MALEKEDTESEQDIENVMKTFVALLLIIKSTNRRKEIFQSHF